MSFANVLSKFNDIEIFFILIFVSIFISLIAITLVRRTIPLKLRYRDNPVIGTTANLIAVIYGVLAGFMALYLINNNSYAADAVQREANAIADIYRDSKWLKDSTPLTIQKALKQYILNVIESEWPRMAAGKKIDITGDKIIDNITEYLLHYNAITNAESLLVHDMMDQIRSLYDARHQRINMSNNQLDPEVWVVILIGTILTLFINYLFGMNFYMHIITVIAASIMTTSVIFLMVTLDRPFQGEFAIQPTAISAILTRIDEHVTSPPAV